MGKEKKAEDPTPKKGKKGLVALIIAVAGTVVAVLAKKKHDQDLDDSLWDEPRSL